MGFYGGAIIGESTNLNVYILFRDATTPTQGLPTITRANISGSIRRIGDPSNDTTINAGDLLAYTDANASPHQDLGFWDDGQGVGVLGIPDSILARGKAGDSDFLPTEILIHLDITGTSEYQFHKSFPVIDPREVFWAEQLVDLTTRGTQTIPEQCQYISLLSLVQRIDGVSVAGKQTLYDESGTALRQALLTALPTDASVIGERKQFTVIP